MANGDAKVRRILYLKMKVAPGVDREKMLAMIQPAIPFFETWGGGRIKLMRNVDDPTQFVQVVEYEASADVELNRHRIASDPMMQTFLQTWRMMVAGAIDVDVFEEVTPGD